MRALAPFLCPAFHDFTKRRLPGTSVSHEHELPVASTAPPESARGPVRWGQLLLPALTLLLAGMSVMVAVRPSELTDCTSWL